MVSVETSSGPDARGERIVDDADVDAVIELLRINYDRVIPRKPR